MRHKLLLGWLALGLKEDEATRSGTNYEMRTLLACNINFWQPAVGACRFKIPCNEFTNLSLRSETILVKMAHK